MNEWVSPPVLIQIASILIVVGGAYATIRNLAQESNKNAQAALAHVAALQTEVMEFKIQVAKDYATNAAIDRVEGNLITSIERLGDRLDRLVELISKPSIAGH